MMKQICFFVAIIACFQWVDAEETETAEIKTCPAASLSVTASPSKYYCGSTPGYTVGTPPAAASAKPTLASGTATITLSTPLTLSSATQCGISATTPVTCDKLYLTLGTADDKDDGSEIVLGSMKFDGLAHWECADAATPTANTFHYYFLVKVGTDANTEATVADTITEVNKIFKDEAPTYGSIDFSIFEHFADVGKTTSIYFFKESDTKAHTVFYSTDTLITFDATQFSSLTDGASANLASQTAAGTCADAVQFCFDKDCDKSGAATLMAGSIAMLIPLFFAQF